MKFVAVYRLGEPVTLCWRLERSQADTAAHDSNTIQYDVHAAVGLSADLITFWRQLIRSARHIYCFNIVQTVQDVAALCQHIDRLHSKCPFSTFLAYTSAPHVYRSASPPVVKTCTLQPVMPQQHAYAAKSKCTLFA